MRPLAFLLLCLLLLAGCGSSGLTDSTVSAPSGPPAPPSGAPVGTKAVSSKSDGPVTPGATVTNVQVNLQQGWNGVGFQSQLLTALTTSAQISGQATWNGTSYATGNFDTATLNAGAGLRRGFWVFAQSATSFTYSGIDNGNNSVDLTIPGYQMVSFCTATDVPGSSLIARQNGNVVPLGSVVLPQFFEIGAQGQPYVTVDVQNGGVLKPGKAYWIFANVAAGAVQLSYNPLGPTASPSPSPGSSPAASPSPGSSPAASPSPGATPTPGTTPVATSLIFSSQPGAAINSTTSTSFQVQVRDQFGRLFTGTSVSVSLAIKTGPAGATIDTTAVSSATGTITLPRTLSKVGSYVLEARSTGLTPAVSNAITVNPGAATQVGFVSQPSAGNVGQDLGSFTLGLLDANNNQLFPTPTIAAFTVNLTPTGGSLQTNPTTVNWIANTNNLTVTTARPTATATAMALVATPSGGSGLAGSTSTTFAVSDGTGNPNGLVISAPSLPSSAAAGSTVTFTVQIRNRTTNVLDTTATNSVTLSLANGPPGSVITSGGATSITSTAVAGVATFSVVPSPANATLGLTFLASSAGFAPQAGAGALTVTPGAAASLRFSAQPAITGVASTATATYTVQVLDAQGNVKTDAAGAVTFTLGSGLGQVFSGTTAQPLVVAVASGVATLNGRLPVGQPAAVVQASYPGLPSINANPVKVTDDRFKNGNLVAASATLTDQPSLSNDSRWQVYTQMSGGFQQVFRRDRFTGDIVLVSAQDGTSATGAGANCFRPTISDDGNRVVFHSQAANLVPGFTAGAGGPWNNVFIRLVSTNQTLLVSRDTAAATTGGNRNSENAFISADGSRVSFESQASTLNTGNTLLTAGGDNTVRQILQAPVSSSVGTMTVATVNTTTPARADADCVLGGTSSDGLTLVYRSSASNLNGTGTNQVFRTLLSGSTVSAVARVSASSFAGSLPTVSDNGFVTFTSTAPALTLFNVSNSQTTVVPLATAAIGAQVPVIDRTGGFIVYLQTGNQWRLVRLSDNTVLSPSLNGAAGVAPRGVVTSGAAYIGLWATASEFTVEPGP